MLAIDYRCDFRRSRKIEKSKY